MPTAPQKPMARDAACVPRRAGPEGSGFRKAQDLARPNTSLRSADDGGQGNTIYHLAWQARRIELSFGKYTIVDAEDYKRVSQYQWCAVEKAQTWYALTFQLDGAILSMHRIIVETDGPTHYHIASAARFTWWAGPMSQGT
jgi:hypothetical protein